MTQFKFETTADEAASVLSEHIKGKTILITGVTKGGLGFETARAISHHNPKLLILAGRSPKNNEDAKEAILKEAPEVEIKLLELDLGSLEKVRQAAEVVKNGQLDGEGGIDVLINNAAIMGGAEYKQTVDGFEDKFAVNHLGPFLFTNLIMERILRAGKGARIVNVSSRGHRRSSIRWDDLNFGEGKTYNDMLAYGQSKTGNILFAVSLAEKLKSKGVLAYALHPGGIMTNLARNMSLKQMQDLGFVSENGKPKDTDALKWKNISQGASTQVIAAFDPSIVVTGRGMNTNAFGAILGRSGAYLNDGNIDDVAVEAYAIDKDNAERLWKLSETLVGQEFSY